VAEEEEVTREEIEEERAFLDACVDTQVVTLAFEWMQRKGLVKADKGAFKRFLHRMWFSLFPRAQRKLGSCAFEHVFLGEIKQGQVNGFHNWLFFLTMEQKGKVNYYGFNFGLSFKGKGGVIKSVFEWDGMVKPVSSARQCRTAYCKLHSLQVSSIFIGLSPELELIVYTLCALLKPDKRCNISLAGKTIPIQTHVFTMRGKKYLGSAYPDL
jgi:poly(U)-specific endoribonuclease